MMVFGVFDEENFWDLYLTLFDTHIQTHTHTEVSDEEAKVPG